jgi:1-aminocyclopropane-1-carboxylate deaminase/D-cysteine desulfhydrase-like pyridoxal-dependent ACC family enzyme
MSDHGIAVEFRDDWVGAGYEQADESVHNTIDVVSTMTGLVLDPTYTGKAFTALLDLLEQGDIAPGSNVLFWHTGGLLNLLASQYYASER